MPGPKTPTERDLKTRYVRCQRTALRNGRDVSKSRRFGTYQLANLDGSNPRTFATLEALEQYLGIINPTRSRR